MSGNLYHPLKLKTIDMSKTDVYGWANEFMSELSAKRKLALRMGVLQEQESGFRIKPKTVNKLCRGEIGIEDLKDSLNAGRKPVRRSTMELFTFVLVLVAVIELTRSKRE